MTWVKLNYDRFLLALFAVALLACAGLLFNNARTFAGVFDGIKGQVTQKSIVPHVDEDAVIAQQKHLGEPDGWTARMVAGRRLPVFVSVPYIAKTTLGADGAMNQEIVDPLDGSADRQLHPPVPNGWLIDNKQDLLSPNVLEQDSDGDGFSTLDEYVGKTDPMDKVKHPPYYSKLVMTQLKRIPFRLRFDAKNGDTIQINVIDVPEAPTWFGKVGGMINLTKPPFKVVKFEQKTSNAKGFAEDVSEVTVENQETKEQIVLPKRVEVDSPTSYAILNYLWSGKLFAVKKNQEFTLKPEDSVKYKCMDMTDTQVRIMKEDENKELIIKLAAAAPPK